jgi:hypothetical protein
MADYPDPRLYRGQYRDTSSGTPAPATNDPLAELARLIGNDSFAEFGRDGGRQSAEPAATPEWNADPAYAPQTGYPPTEAYPADQYPYTQQNQSQSYPQTYDQQDFVEPQFQDSNAAYPGYAPDQAGHYAPPAQDRQQDQQYAPQYYPDTQQPVRQPPEFLGQRGFPPAGYAADAPAHDEYYDDVPPTRRRGVLMAAAAAALIIVGTAGAFGYRALFGSASSGPPPVIKADATPTKVVSAPSSDSSSNKSIQDRIGDQINERVVSREEQPADVKPQPRVVLPGPTANGNTATPGGAVASEPKKIRTVAIRPDQQGGTDSGPAPRTPAVVASPAPGPSPVARQVVPSPSSGPLSLSPDAGPAPAAAAPARPAPRPAPQVASAAPAGPGAYVQVSSQRSEGDAQASFRALQTKYPSVLGNKTASIQRADLGDKGTYYRAMVGPLAGPDAVDLCSSLKAAGGTCVIQKN